MRKRNDLVSHLRKAVKMYHCFTFQHFITIRISIYQYLKAFFRYLMMMMMMMMMIMMIMTNRFCGVVDRRKTFSLLSSRNYCQRSSPLWISDTSRAGFEPAQNLSLGLLEWSCAIVITTTPCFSWHFLWYSFCSKKGDGFGYANSDYVFEESSCAKYRNPYQNQFLSANAIMIHK